MGFESIYTAPGILYLVSTLGMAILAKYTYSLDKGKLKKPGLLVFTSASAMSLSALSRVIFEAHWQEITTLFTIALFFTGFGWFYFVSEFVRQDVNKNIVRGLFTSYLFLAIAMLVTSPSQGFFGTYKPSYFEGVVSAVVFVDGGPLYILTIIVSYPMFFYGLWLLAKEMFQTQNKLRKRQVIYLLVGSIPSIIGDFVGTLLYNLYALPFEPVLLSFAFVTSPLFLYSIVSHDFINKQPVTREKVIEHLDSAVMSISEDDTILDINPRGEDFFGVRSKERAKFSELPEEIQDHIQSFKEGDLEVDESVAHMESDDKWLEISLIKVPQHNNENHIAVTVRDITERKKRLNQLIVKNKRLDQFSSVISHDMNNHLQTGISYATLAKTKTDDEEIKEKIEKTEKALNSISNIVEDARDMTETQSDTVHENDFSTIVEEVKNDVENGDVKIKNEIDLTIQSDRGSVRRLIANLIRNSIEHGGDELSCIVVGNLGEKEGFYVSDDGKGFDNTDEDLFEAGYTTSETGSGLGLSISQTVAELHDWEIRATESELDGARTEIITE